MRSNHICFEVTFTRPFVADQDRLLALLAPSVSGFSSSLCPFFKFLFPQISNGLPNILKVLSHTWTQCGQPHPIPGAGRGVVYLSFHS